MIDPAPSDAEKRKAFRQDLQSGRLLRMPGAFSPLVAMLIEQTGFEGVYVSGAVLSANLGLPDIGLTSVTEVTQTASIIARATRLPTIVDLDTGFGEPVNVARAIGLAEDAGLVGGHLEDQTLPKRCGHLDHKELIDIATMAQKSRRPSMRDATDSFPSLPVPMLVVSRGWTLPLTEPGPMSMPEPI